MFLLLFLFTQGGRVMTEIEKFEKLKLLLGLDLDGYEKDALLSAIYEQAENTFLSYTNRTLTPVEAIPVVLGLAITRYNRLGTEGLDSTNYSSISEKYSTEFSDAEKANLNRWRRMTLL